jgi:hypothetical protein
MKTVSLLSINAYRPDLTHFQDIRLCDALRELGKGGAKRCRPSSPASDVAQASDTDARAQGEKPRALTRCDIDGLDETVLGVAVRSGHICL